MKGLNDDNDNYKQNALDINKRFPKLLQLTLDGCVRIFSTIESMHRPTRPKFSDHSGSFTVVCRATTESFQPWRMHELKKASSFDTKLPFWTDSVILRNFAAHIAGTKLWALRFIIIP